MSLINLIKGALINIKANKMRVFLTMIGIIIGISSVVVVLSVGDGVKANINSSTEDTNINKVNIMFSPNDYNQDINLLSPFTEIDLDNIKNIEGVEKIEKPKEFDIFSALEGTLIGEAKYLDKTTNIYATTYEKVTSKPELAFGRYFDNGDVNNDLIIIRYEVAKQIFGNAKEAINKAININSTMFQVIGVMKESEDIFSSSDDLIQQSSIDRIKSNESKSNDSVISSIDVYVLPGYDFNTVVDNVKNKLEQAHPQIDGIYEAMNPGDITKAFDTIISSITIFISLITSISLLVGGIGVMNIMYVSVTERKREIGIRRAIGATPRSIMLQFLFEAVFVTLIGGLLGIIFGFLLSQLVGLFMPFKPVLTIKSFIGSSSVSIIVGIVFGMIPAYKASKLEPIEAIYK